MCDSADQSLAVGFFDGVHLGHQAILRGADRALTFRAHPLSVLAPDRAPPLIMTFEARVAAIRSCGVREVVALDFTRELAALSPEAFVAHYLGAKGTGPRPQIRCGANWTFGKGGVGNADWLRARGFSVTTVPYATFADAPISSSRIRTALSAGEIGAANAMLGHPFRIFGEVERGKGLGRTFGFPTVNLRPVGLSIGLPRGVYVVSVAGVRGIANYGLAPSLGDLRWPAPMLEIHFPGCDAASVPAAPFAVDVLRFVRRERTFASLDALRAQIARDCRSLA